MAQALKIGESVSVLRTTRLTAEDPAYSQGLKQVQKGQIGQVVELGPGRTSVAVEFNGKRATLPSRRLARTPQLNDAAVEANIESSVEAAPAETPKRRGRKPRAAAPTQPTHADQATPEAAPAPSMATPDAGLLAAVQYDAPYFITAAANKLLATDSSADTILLQIRLGDLPEATRERVQALMRAKLDLGPSASDAASVPAAPKRRGRPKNSSKSK